MNPTPNSRFHLILAACWIGTAAWLAIAIAIASGEKTSLERKRGAEFKERRELVSQHERLRSEIGWLGSAPSIEQAVARLGLPIAPPARLASR
ncbi:MAG: hypothetical protein AAB263_18240 [Planctomycetota bacterium]